MDYKKKVIEEAITHFRHGITHDLFSEPVTTYARLAVEALEFQMHTAQEWISVKDRLPEVGMRVIVCRDEGKVEQGIFLGASGFWKVFGANTKKVTHWQPLPEPPKEENP